LVRLLFIFYRLLAGLWRINVIHYCIQKFDKTVNENKLSILGTGYWEYQLLLRHGME